MGIFSKHLKEHGLWWKFDGERMGHSIGVYLPTWKRLSVSRPRGRNTLILRSVIHVVLLTYHLNVCHVNNFSDVGPGYYLDEWTIHALSQLDTCTWTSDCQAPSQSATHCFWIWLEALRQVACIGTQPSLFNIDEIDYRYAGRILSLKTCFFMQLHFKNCNLRV